MTNFTNKDVNIENLDKLEDEKMFDSATLKRLKYLYRAKKKAVELEVLMRQKE